MSGKTEWPATGQTLLLGDAGVLLRAVGAAEYAHLKGEEELFCAKHGLREKVSHIYQYNDRFPSFLPLVLLRCNLGQSNTDY